MENGKLKTETENLIEGDSLHIKKSTPEAFVNFPLHTALNLISLSAFCNLHSPWEFHFLAPCYSITHFII